MGVGLIIVSFAMFYDEVTSKDPEGITPPGKLIKKIFEFPSRFYKELGFSKKHKILSYLLVNLLVLSQMAFWNRIYGFYTDLMLYMSVILVITMYKLMQSIRD